MREGGIEGKRERVGGAGEAQGERVENGKRESKGETVGRAG